MAGVAEAFKRSVIKAVSLGKGINKDDLNNFNYQHSVTSGLWRGIIVTQAS